MKRSRLSRSGTKARSSRLKTGIIVLNTHDPKSYAILDAKSKGIKELSPWAHYTLKEARDYARAHGIKLVEEWL